MFGQWNPLRIVRLLVTSLQLLGVFPYRWKEAHNRPELSGLLCLWAMFTKLAMLSGYSYLYEELRAFPHASVGELAQKISIAASKNLALFTYFLLVCKSPHLKAILVKLGTLHEETIPEKVTKHVLWSTVKSLITLELFYSLPLHGITLIYYISGTKSSITYKMFNIIVHSLDFQIYVVSLCLFDVLLSTLGSYLSNQTLEMTEKMTQWELFLQDNSTVQSPITTHKFSHMFNLEQTIRKVCKTLVCLHKHILASHKFMPILMTRLLYIVICICPKDHRC